MEDGKKDLRCTLSQDSVNDFVDDMECDPFQPLSDLHQQDQLHNESDENSPSQQYQSLYDNLDSNHPTSSLEHIFSHVESLFHPNFEVLKMSIYRRHQRNVRDHHRRGHIYLLQILVIPRRKMRSKKNSQTVLTLFLRIKSQRSIDSYIIIHIIVIFGLLSSYASLVC